MSLRGRRAAVAILKPKAWHPVAKHGSTKQEEIPITKDMDSLLHSASPLFIYGSVSFRATIVRSGMANRSVKDCRVGRTRPPRNDRIGRFDRKHGTQNPIFGFRKAFLICCLILTVSDFFDSLKRPRGSDESRGRCYLRGKSHSADFQFETGFQPIFQATMESPYLIIS